MKNERWEAYKPEIKRLYITEGKSKEKVMKTMELTHGFVASSIQIGLRRNAYESKIQSLQLASLPSTPEGVIVCSPAPPCDLGLQWPEDLPWFSFLRQLSILDVKFDSTPSIQKSWTLGSIGYESDPFRTSIPFDLSLALDPLQGHVYRAVAPLRTIMPVEEREGQHEATAQSLQTASPFSELPVALYMFSNNIQLISYSDERFPLPFHTRRSEFRVLRDILQECKLDDAKNMRNLLAFKDLTAEVIAHKIFRASIEIRDKEMVRIMLEAGMCPNTPLLIDNFRGTALQYVSGIFPPETACDLANILLSHGASTEPMNAEETPLTRAIEYNNTALFKLLVAHGAIPSSQALRMAASRKSWVKIIIDYFEMLYNAGFDLSSTTVDGKTLLGISKDVVLTKWLIDHGCDVNAPQICELQNDSYDWVNHITSPLGIAAADGKLAIMQVLLKAGANIDLPLGLSGSVSPLVLAVYSSDIKSTQFLLDAGADVISADQFKMLHETVRKTLIQRAWHRQDLCLALLLSGAYASRGERLSILDLPMIEAVKASDSDMASYLISLGAPVNPIVMGSSLSAIALAIMNGAIGVISLLKDSGVSISDLFVPSVGGIRTAEYLKSAGWLPEILRLNGARILATAIGRHDETLASFLIGQGVGHDDSNSMVPTLDLPEKELRPIESAIYEDDISLAQLLISHGSHVNESDINMIVSKAVQKDSKSPFMDLLSILEETKSSWSFFLDPETLRKVAPLYIGRRGERVLLEAIKSNDLKLVKMILGAEIGLHHRPSPDEVFLPDDALSLAVNESSCEIISELLTITGADVNRRSNQYGRALPVAIRKKKHSLIKLLIENGANVNIESELNERALQVAVDQNDFFLVKTLVEKGADINAQSNFHETVLHRALLREYSSIAELLIENGADANIQSDFYGTAFHIAANLRNYSVATILIDKGANVNMRFDSGGGVLHMAVKEEDHRLVKFLIENGADVNLQSDYGETVLQTAATQMDYLLVELLIESGADVDIQSDRDGTLLQDAIHRQDYHLAKILIEGGAYLHDPPNPEFGNSPLQMASEQGHTDLVSLLLQKGADPNQSPLYDSGATALQFAAIKGFSEIVHKLIEAGAAVDAPGSILYGRTAIEGAAEWGQINILYFLIKQGSSPTGPNRRQYLRAVNLAEKQGHYPIVRFLKDWIRWTDSDERNYVLEVFDEEEARLIEYDEDDEDEDYEGYEGL
ncbi:hypothetical protein N7509_001176 [Penicillium cosmopolitanum]|uniref:Clr5 domain-containing protein n=1 Tax=Penicillium cosmopolitanum TaxID=1131564 RepID=A0A9W9WBM9_9EURO|nr:uncharacterized protein N7509_001176 [Penicillium cosmopolitanum]KAJ5414549.1 hypothetical protein N7509_001176 [Penicillium cosmopolitanum]